MKQCAFLYSHGGWRQHGVICHVRDRGDTPPSPRVFLPSILFGFTIEKETPRRNGRYSFQMAMEDVEECCVCLEEEWCLPVTNCCGQSIHKTCLARSLQNYLHCPHCRSPTSIVSFFLWFFIFCICFMFMYFFGVFFSGDGFEIQRGV